MDCSKKLGDLKPTKRLSLALLCPWPPWRDTQGSHCMVATVTLSCVSLTTSLQNPPGLAVSHSTSAKLSGRTRATEAHGSCTEDLAAVRGATAAGARGQASQAPALGSRNHPGAQL